MVENEEAQEREDEEEWDKNYSQTPCFSCPFLTSPSNNSAFLSSLSSLLLPCQKQNVNYCNPPPYCVFVDIRAELMPDELPDRSEVTKFDQAKLKHVQPTEKIVLPSKEGKSRDSLIQQYVVNKQLK